MVVMMAALVVLAEQIDAVIIAIRGADHGVDMPLARLGIGQEQAGMVVELDEQDRAKSYRPNRPMSRKRGFEPSVRFT